MNVQSEDNGWLGLQDRFKVDSLFGGHRGVLVGEMSAES